MRTNRIPLMEIMEPSSPGISTLYTLATTFGLEIKHIYFYVYACIYAYIVTLYHSPQRNWLIFKLETFCKQIRELISSPLVERNHLRAERVKN